jgi:phenylalanyl-tRNA synthetase beta subunit
MNLLRQTLIPGLLASVELNRRHSADLKLVEVGSVFHPDGSERRRLAMAVARRQKGSEDDLLAELKGSLETWAAQTQRRAAMFRSADADQHRPWEHPQKTADVFIGDVAVGRVSALPLATRRAMDEHLAAWSIVWAEVELDDLCRQSGPVEKLQPVPAHPEVDLDFSFLVPATRRYTAVADTIACFRHPLLRRVHYVGSYEGKSIPADRRSLTVRCRIGDPDRTLVDDDIASFRSTLEQYLEQCGWSLRR